MAISIDQRYDDLLSLSTINPQTVIGWSHISTADVRSAVLVVLQNEYDKSVYNEWAGRHGVPTLP